MEIKDRQNSSTQREISQISAVDKIVNPEYLIDTDLRKNNKAKFFYSIGKEE